MEAATSFDMIFSRHLHTKQGELRQHFNKNNNPEHIPNRKDWWIVRV
jgi:hypothetical protein